jgi:hypothetical protein
MNSARQQFILVPFVHGFNSFRVSSVCPTRAYCWYVHSRCRDGIVVSYVTDVLVVTCGYWSAGLSHIDVFTRVAFKLVNSTGVGIVRLL